MARSGSPSPRRGRSRRRWVTADGTPVSRPEPEQAPDTAPTDPGTAPPPAATHRMPPAAAPVADTRRPEPRRRYPWHDDPDYDPTAHRRTPPPPPSYVARPAPPPPPSPHSSEEDTAPRRSEEPVPGRGPDGADRGTDADTVPTPGRGATAPRRMPRKLTVTRVAALRSREITENSIRAFRRAATADGAERSGLTALTYATMLAYAVDAAVAVALANTLFFAAATAESKTNVMLYLAITVAPFAVVAPVIGPLLDRIQRGRRAALAASFAGRAVLAVVMALNYDTWLLYPAALGVMVLSKSFHVLKAAVTPRVLPASITLVTTNSRLTVFGLAAGTVLGGVASGIAALSGSPGALVFTALLAVAGTVLCLRIPAWVESTEGEVPASIRATRRGRRAPMGVHVLAALWGNGSLRALTGFLTLFVAFVVKAQAEEEPARQLLLIGIIGAAGGAGSFVGNALGAREFVGRSEWVVVACVGIATAAAVTVTFLPGIATVAAVALVAGTCSALAKVSLDAVIQRDLPEESRASAFGRSETVLQLAWVFGGAIGLLMPHTTYWIGFTVIACVVALGGVQTLLLTRSRSLLPFLGPRVPTAASPPPTAAP